MQNQLHATQPRCHMIAEGCAYSMQALSWKQPATQTPKDAAQESEKEKQETVNKNTLQENERRNE